MASLYKLVLHKEQQHEEPAIITIRNPRHILHRIPAREETQQLTRAGYLGVRP